MPGPGRGRAGVRSGIGRLSLLFLGARARTNPGGRNVTICASWHPHHPRHPIAKASRGTTHRTHRDSSRRWGGATLSLQGWGGRSMVLCALPAACVISSPSRGAVAVSLPALRPALCAPLPRFEVTAWRGFASTTRGLAAEIASAPPCLTNEAARNLVEGTLGIRRASANSHIDRGSRAPLRILSVYLDPRSPFDARVMSARRPCASSIGIHR
jgi:hypothetical protein